MFERSSSTRIAICHILIRLHRSRDIKPACSLALRQPTKNRLWVVLGPIYHLGQVVHRIQPQFGDDIGTAFGAGCTK